MQFPSAASRRPRSLTLAFCEEGSLARGSLYMEGTRLKRSLNISLKAVWATVTETTQSSVYHENSKTNVVILHLTDMSSKRFSHTLYVLFELNEISRNCDVELRNKFHLEHRQKFRMRFFCRLSYKITSRVRPKVLLLYTIVYRLY